MEFLNRIREEKKSTFFGGVAVLAVGIAIVKVLGALFKIPVGNILGDVGFGHFNNAYVVYNLLLMISTAGLPLALSKTIAEADALDRRNQVQRTFRVALIAFLILGTVTTVVMYLFAPQLAALQGDTHAAHAVRAIAPACFLVCVISAFRGYAQGHGNMVPTSVSQVIEAAVKVALGTALAVYLIGAGAGMDMAAAGAILGVTVGAGVALLYLIWDFLRRKKTKEPVANDRTDSVGFILKRLLAIAVPITLGASIVPITTWLDTVQVQNILRGILGEEATWAAYGSYQKAITIFNLPPSFMVAVTAAIIPAISASIVRQNWGRVRKLAESSLRISSLIAFPAGIGLAAAADPIIHFLYFGTDYSVAVPCMAILGLASVFVCLMFLCNSILQASGFVNLPIIVMAIGCVAKLGVNNFLVRREGVGVIGAPIGTLVCYIIVAALELYLIKRVIPQAPSYRKTFIKPLIASLLMGGAAWAASGLLTGFLSGIGSFRFVVEATGQVMLSRLGYGLVTMGSIGVAVVVYGVLIVVLRAITREDLSLMPKGDKIASLLRLKD